jgi:exodeoxyribonuclease VIII
MKHFMIDLETLATKSNAMILTIGAIEFDPMTENMDGNIFYKKINLNSYKNINGFSFDINTMCWWHNQCDEARKEAFLGDDRIDLKNCLIDLKNWLDEVRPKGTGNNVIIWSHGSHFDIPILSNAYNIFEMKEPWNYWNVRDTRTLFDISNINFKDIQLPIGMVAHNALADCFKQVTAVKLAYKNLFFKN